MKQLSINTAKNVTIKDLVCTPNTIVLAKQTMRINANSGEITTTVRYIEVCQVEKTDALTLVKKLLKYCVAEFLVCKEIEAEFEDTKIKQRKIFNQFLTGDTIYRTDSNGKISKALVSEVPLNQTALNVKDYHAIASCKPENYKAAIHKHSQVFLVQCKYLRLIIDKAETLDKEAETVTEAVAETVTETEAVQMPIVTITEAVAETEAEKATETVTETVAETVAVQMPIVTITEAVTETVAEKATETVTETEAVQMPIVTVTEGETVTTPTNRRSNKTTKTTKTGMIPLQAATA